jgi:hypothetical protein
MADGSIRLRISASQAECRRFDPDRPLSGIIGSSSDEETTSVHICGRFGAFPVIFMGLGLTPQVKDVVRRINREVHRATGHWPSWRVTRATGTLLACLPRELIDAVDGGRIPLDDFMMSLVGTSLPEPPHSAGVPRQGNAPTTHPPHAQDTSASSL